MAANEGVNRTTTYGFGRDEFPVDYSSAVAPAGSASASPTVNDSQQPMLPYSDFAANGNNRLNSVSQPNGALQALPLSSIPPRALAKLHALALT
jgi:hypothetical protein